MNHELSCLPMQELRQGNFEMGMNFFYELDFSRLYQL